MRYVNANHKINQTPEEKKTEEKNQTEIKISKYHQVCLSLSQLQKTTCPNVANSYTGQLALRMASQQTLGTCQHLCICPHGAIQSCKVATNSLVQQKGSPDLANSSSKTRESNTAITLSGHTAFSRYPIPEVTETSPLASKANAKIAFSDSVSDAKINNQC